MSPQRMSQTPESMTSLYQSSQGVIVSRGFSEMIVFISSFLLMNPTSHPTDSAIRAILVRSSLEMAFFHSNCRYRGRPSASYPSIIGHPSSVPIPMTVICDLVSEIPPELESVSSPSVMSVIWRLGSLPYIRTASLIAPIGSLPPP
jgi:hypothetical protein